MESGKIIYFVSDIHLGNRYMDDYTVAEKKIVQWMDSVKENASAIYFLGDIFDYWYEYKHVVPRGFVRFLGKLAELSDYGIEIHIFTGNHDIWMYNYLQKEIGATVYRNPVTVDLLGKRFFLGHGDEVGYRPLKYRIIQSVFRNKICQILYSSLHPRWTFDFAQRWSLNSRKSGLAAKKSLEEAQKRNTQSLTVFAENHLKTDTKVNFFIFGHLHILLDKQITSDCRLIITGDWMQLFSYAEWDGKELNLNHYI
jgi:UDP-2,3-diacylglucosamine hydrolase